MGEQRKQTKAEGEKKSPRALLTCTFAAHWEGLSLSGELPPVEIFLVALCRGTSIGIQMSAIGVDYSPPQRV